MTVLNVQVYGQHGCPFRPAVANTVSAKRKVSLNKLAALQSMVSSPAISLFLLLCRLLLLSEGEHTSSYCGAA